MVDMYIRYEGGLRCVARHGPSGATLQSDAPVDNHGKGESFSPTDLLATALGTCMLTVMGILAQKRGWDIEGCELHVIKDMTQSPPRRVEQLQVRLSVPLSAASRLNQSARDDLEDAARNCPVRLSIHPQIEVPLVFDWSA
jgi:putative redox protein